jgi:hypothetical protein
VTSPNGSGKETLYKGSGKWTLYEVEQLAAVMVAKGLTLVEVAGLKLVRHPQAGLYDNLGAKAAEFQSAARPATDEEILANPLAGIEEALNHG